MLRRRLQIQLVQRQPLAEKAARFQPAADGLEVFDRVQRAGAAARRVEVVGDDHVVALLARAHVAPGVRGDHVQP